MGPSGCGKTTLLRIIAGPGESGRRHAAAAGRGHQRRAGAQAQHPADLAGLFALPLPQRAQEHRVRADAQAPRQEGGARQGRGRGRAGSSGPPALAPHRPVERRREAAGRHRPGAGHRARDPSPRRAAQLARRAFADQGAERAHGAAAGAWNLLRLRHPQPERSLRDGGSGGGDEQGCGGADRPAGRDLQSSGNPLRRRIRGRQQHLRRPGLGHGGRQGGGRLQPRQGPHRRPRRTRSTRGPPSSSSCRRTSCAAARTARTA